MCGKEPAVGVPKIWDVLRAGMIPILGAVNKMVPGNHVEWRGIEDVVRWIDTWTVTREYRRFDHSWAHVILLSITPG